MLEYYCLKGFESGNVVSEEVLLVYALVQLSGCNLNGYWMYSDLPRVINQDLNWECAVDQVMVLKLLSA